MHLLVNGHNIAFAAGTSALIAKRGHVSKINVLSDSHRAAVAVNVNGAHKVVLTAGQTVTIGSDKDAAFARLGMIARRRVQQTDLQNVSILVCEESPLSVIENSGTLTQLLKSSAKSDRQISNNILKMAACLTVVTAQHGLYSQERR